jgi:hypothetical protein
MVWGIAVSQDTWTRLSRRSVSRRSGGATWRVSQALVIIGDNNLIIGDNNLIIGDNR